MKKRYILLFPITLLLCITPHFGQTIWDGPPMVFSKSAFADPTQEANQDRITDNVWITRANQQGLFNAKLESSYNPEAPADTEWGQGTTSEIASINFQPWVDAMSMNPPSNTGIDFVLHLISEDIYIDIRINSWGQGGNAGGSFSYTRSTPPLTNTHNTDTNNEISISPNPTTDWININSDAPNQSYRIFNLSNGALTSSISSSDSKRIHTSDWAPGIYVLISNSGVSRRFVKM